MAKKERPPQPDTARERLLQRYAAFKATNPGVSYSHWLEGVELESVMSGKPHATLGPRLRRFENWWEAGDGTFKRYRKWFPFIPSSRIVDYGCGSLRVGGHFIKFLDPERYVGLDVISGFYDMGKALIGPELMAEKKPRFAVIDDASVRDAAAFAPDFVYSSAVSYHIHPDEAADYFRSMQAICHKPGATLFFDVSVSDAPIHDLQLSMPLDYFKDTLPELQFIQYYEIERIESLGQSIGVIRFRRQPGVA
ncbi:MAG TPA: methyltransferase domain-containing protein [Rhizomicrobium sp.]|nr:methyltransferase domain-containing protein [Rhizomicrobium sp.]